MEFEKYEVDYPMSHCDLDCCSRRRGEIFFNMIDLYFGGLYLRDRLLLRLRCCRLLDEFHVHCDARPIVLEARLLPLCRCQCYSTLH
eukprot:7969339-Pyramimonas_sp.AAC.1